MDLTAKASELSRPHWRWNSMPSAAVRCLCLTAVTHFSLSCVSLLVAQQGSKVLAPHKPIAPKVSHSFPMPAPVAGSMVGGPWMVDANFKSSVYIKNGVETSAITVTPVLYLSNGVAYKLSDITLEPSGTSIIDIGASLEKLGIAPYATLSGYIELEYNWPWDPICGTIRNFDATHSLIFNYNLRSSKAPDLPGAAVKSTSRTSRTIEGLWWKQEPNVSGFVTLTNTTSQSFSANVELSDDAGKTFSQKTAQISPHGTKMLQMNNLATTQAASGGIRITYSGTATDLLVNGGLEDIGVGYSAGIPFSAAPASSTSSSITVAELGLMTGPADPMMRFPTGTTFSPYTILRNVSNSVITATPTLWWMAGGTAQSFQLSVVSLAPLQSQSVDFSGFLTQAGLKNFSGNVQLAFQVQGNAGGLLIAGGSVDKTNTYVFEVAPHAVAESASKSLSYWSIADGDDTMVTIWNPADEAQDFVFQLTYTGGHYNYPIHLEARSTRTFNISAIVESGGPDAEGNVIPTTVHDGGARIMGSQAENEHILVNIDSGVYNVRKATCGQYCQSCDGVTSWSVADDPFTVPVSEQHQLTFYENWNTGSQYDDTSASNWTSSAGSVATVGTPGNGTPGNVSGVSAGTSDIGAEYLYDDPAYTSYWCEGGPWSCPYTYIVNGQAASSGTVNPSISSIFPTQGLVGTAIPVTISGAGFAAGARVNAGSNIAVAGVTVVSASQITATFTPVNSTTAGGNQGVTVTVPSGQTSNSQNFFVQIPSHIAYINELSTPYSGHSNTTSGADIDIINYDGSVGAYNVCGGYQWMSYKLTDQNGTQIVNGNVNFSETFSNGSPPQDPFGSIPSPGPAFTINLATQVLGDTYAIWNTAPPACLPPNVSDSFNQNWTPNVGGVVSGSVVSGGVTYPVTTVISASRSTNSQGLPSFNVSISTP